jgi:hypothetical protein
MGQTNDSLLNTYQGKEQSQSSDQHILLDLLDRIDGGSNEEGNLRECSPLFNTKLFLHQKLLNHAQFE